MGCRLWGRTESDPSGEPGVSGDFWGSQEGCQGAELGEESQDSSCVEEWKSACISSCSWGDRPLVELYAQASSAFRTPTAGSLQSWDRRVRPRLV